jgi:hypothetical protein
MRKHIAWITITVLIVAAVLGAIAILGGSSELDAARFQRVLEMPSHEKLMETMKGAEPTPFVTDGCSGGLSTAWRGASDLFPGLAALLQGKPPWEDCCVQHDRVYHLAGAATSADGSYAARLAADEDLRQCVIATGRSRTSQLMSRFDVSEEQVANAYAAIGDAMFKAVRVGGIPCSGLDWRWGYGYPQCRAAVFDLE